MKASAYLSVFDDWDLLSASIASIAPFVDEIVVVDGAYRWMAPFFAATGRDPAYSDERVRQALAPWGGKLRWINQLWDNEPQKRAAGYAACTHDRIFRVDSDEVLFMDGAALERHLSGGRAVAEMSMPIMVAPKWIRGQPGHPPERQALLFDRTQLGPDDHLAYLWLVLPPEERARLAAPDAARISPDPVAFNAHLTHWRPPASALTRARFYVLNWLRESGHGVDWAPGFRFAEPEGFAPLFAAIPPQRFTDLMMGHRIVAGLPDLAGHALLPSPLAPAQDATLAGCFGAFLDGLAALNAGLTRGRFVATGETCHIDLSTPAARAPFGPDGTVHLAWSQPLAAVVAEADTLLPAPPWVVRTPVPVTLSGKAAQLHLPPAPGALRQVLRVGAWPATPATLLGMRAAG